MPNQRAAGVTPRTIAFPDDLWVRVQQAADDREVKPSVVVRDAVEEYVSEEES